MPSQSGGLMLVHAHPDDEVVATGGVIARSVAEGRRVDLVTSTGGEEGEIHDPELDVAQAKPRLAEIRRAELDCSVAALGGDAIRLHLLGYRDSGMMGEPSNDLPKAFWQADLSHATGRLVRLVREARPAVMVSYDSNGNYGHPDHINAHRIAVAAFAAAADGSQYPEAGPPHEVAKLYEIAFAREPWLALMNEMRERGISLPWDFDAAVDAAAALDAAADRPAEELNPSNAEGRCARSAMSWPRAKLPTNSARPRRGSPPPSTLPHSASRSGAPWPVTAPSARTWAGCWTCRRISPRGRPPRSISSSASGAATRSRACTRPLSSTASKPPGPSAHRPIGPSAHRLLLPVMSSGLFRAYERPKAPNHYPR
jgi:LmbE family N-acetylglucosaminyl deacetylase